MSGFQPRCEEPHPDLALIWTRYDYHIDGEFSRCGTDSVVP